MLKRPQREFGKEKLGLGANQTNTKNNMKKKKTGIYRAFFRQYSRQNGLMRKRPPRGKKTRINLNACGSITVLFCEIQRFIYFSIHYC